MGSGALATLRDLFVVRYLKGELDDNEMTCALLHVDRVARLPDATSRAHAILQLAQFANLLRQSRRQAKRSR